MEGMAKKTPLDKCMEAGKQFTEASLKCLSAEARDFAKEGENGRARAEEWAEEFVERGRRTAEQLVDVVRKEVRHQVKQLNLATNQDVIKVVQEFVERTTKAAAPVMDAATRTMAATKKAASAGKSSSAADKTPGAKKSSSAKKGSDTSARSATKKAATAKKTAATKKTATAKKTPATKKATTPAATARSKKAQSTTN